MSEITAFIRCFLSPEGHDIVRGCNPVFAECIPAVQRRILSVCLGKPQSEKTVVHLIDISNFGYNSQQLIVWFQPEKAFNPRLVQPYEIVPIVGAPWPNERSSGPISSIASSSRHSSTCWPDTDLGRRLAGRSGLPRLRRVGRSALRGRMAGARRGGAGRPAHREIQERETPGHPRAQSDHRHAGRLHPLDRLVRIQSRQHGGHSAPPRLAGERLAGLHEHQYRRCDGSVANRLHTVDTHRQHILKNSIWTIRMKPCVTVCLSV